MTEEPVIKTRRKGRSQTQQMLIPSERMLADALKSAPAGQLSDIGALRRTLAEKYGADACCPVTLQRHLVTLSLNGDTPVWRIVDPDRAFAKRLAGVPERIRQKLAAEVPRTNRD